MRKPNRFACLALLALLTATPALAQSNAADIAVQSARLETLRARAAMTPSVTTSTTLIEAESLLRQLRQAPADKRQALSSQLDAALSRLDLEIDSASRFR